MRQLLLIAIFSVFALQVQSQCTIDFTQTTAGIYPDTLQPATAGQPYSQDITFVMLTDTLGLTIYNYQITNIVGLPIGMTWICNNFAGGCNYDPSVSVYGCVNISGTPLVPGNYNPTVTVVADVQLAGQQTISFSLGLLVIPGTVSNPGFSMQNSAGCAPLTVDFINNNPGQLSYLWDFGNGLQSTNENPPSQTYTQPGTYVVTQTVTPNITPTYYLTDLTVSAIPNNYGGFIDDPDLYFLLYDTSGAQIYDSRPALNGVFPPYTWTLPNIPLTPGNFTVHVWDEDGGLFGGDDDLGAATFAGDVPGAGTTTGTVGGASGQLIVNYTIFSPPVNPLVASDTIYVYAAPAVPVINASGPLVICENESLVLSISDTSNSIQWYENGSLIIGATDTLFTPTASGSYSVAVTSPQGCSTASSAVTVTINPIPVKPTFFVNGNIFTTTVTGLNLQWYYNGLPVTGATGNTFTASLNGTYKLCGTDANGCENCSDSLVFVNLSAIEYNGVSFGIFPNPSSGDFTLLFSDALPNRTLVILDAAGRTVANTRLPASEKFIFTDRLDSGIYTVIVETEGRKSFRRLVVQ